MKKLLIASFLFFAITANVLAQSSQVKVIALINEASWCPVCQANGPRFQKDIAPMVMKNPQIQMVKNDLSNNKTQASSINNLKKAGIEDFAKNNTGTGMLYLIDAKSKKLISKISIASTNEQIKQELKEALSKG